MKEPLKKKLCLEMKVKENQRECSRSFDYLVSKGIAEKLGKKVLIIIKKD